MRKLSKEKRDRLVLVGIVTAGLMAVVWLLLIQSGRDRLKQMRTETENLEEQIDGTRRLLKQEGQFKETLAALAEDLNARESGMANGDRYFWFVNTLNKFKTGYDIEIPQISPETVGPVGMFPEFPYQAATFKISGTATYYEFGRFLKDFENTYPYIRFLNLDLKPAMGSKKEQISFNADVVTLIKPNA